MPYRKVGYMEQCWYIVRYKIREVFRKEKCNAVKTQTSVRVSRLPQTDGQAILPPAREDSSATVRQKPEKPTRQ